MVYISRLNSAGHPAEIDTVLSEMKADRGLSEDETREIARKYIGMSGERWTKARSIRAIKEKYSERRFLQSKIALLTDHK